MERLSVATTVDGILIVGADILSTLARIDPEPQDGSTAVGLAIREIKQYRSSIQVLDKSLGLLESSQLPLPQRAAWIRVDYLVAILTDTALALSDFQTTLDADDVVPSPDAETSTAGEESDARIRALCPRIRWLNISLTMILTILKCSSDSEALTCRNSLDQRMKRLLHSNTDLSSRMRNISDVFYSAGATPNRPGLHDARPEVGPASDFSTYTGYVLSDLPVPSLIPLPLTAYELYDSSAFFPAEEYEPVSSPDPSTKLPPMDVSVTASAAAAQPKRQYSFAGRVKRLSPRRRRKDAVREAQAT